MPFARAALRRGLSPRRLTGLTGPQLVILGLVSLGLAGGLTEPASAAHVQVFNDRFVVRASAGEVNALDVSVTNDAIIVNDAVALRAGRHCRLQTGVARCNRAGVARIEISAGDGNDVVTVRSGGLPVRVSGGAGGDRLDTGGEVDELLGGDGADRLRGGGGVDRLSGGAGDDDLGGGPDPDMLLGKAGDDTLSGGAGPDFVDGGPGVDRMSYALRSRPVDVSLDGAPNDGEQGEGDNVLATVDAVTGTAQDDRLVGPQPGQAGATRAVALDGRRGADVLVGGAGGDTLSGGAGDDQVMGGAGADALTGDNGSDTIDGGGSGDIIEARDHPVGDSVDHVHCDGATAAHGGYDWVNADAMDVVDRDCEARGKPGDPSFSAPGGRQEGPPQRSSSQHRFIHRGRHRLRGVKVRIVTFDHRSKITILVVVTFQNKRHHRVGHFRTMHLRLNTWKRVPDLHAPASAKFVHIKRL